MKLTPIDLQQKTFRKVRLSGVDEREVRQFLEQVAAELEELRRKIDQQDEELRRRDERIAEFRDREHLLQQTLTTAQKLADDLRGNARKEAEIIVSDAELQAEKILTTAQARKVELIGEIDELRRARAAFVQNLSAVIETHRAMLEHQKQVASEHAAADKDNISFLAPPAAAAASKKK